MKKKLICSIFLFLIILFSKKEEIVMEDTKINNIETKTLFCNMEIPIEISSKMQGKSMPNGAKISYDDLSYIKVKFYDFNGNTNEGELIVNKKLADEVIEIFEELYEKHYQIEKIKLIDEYDANDEKSMEDNNTSSFCYRVIKGTNKLSNHAKGCAIDINPLQNPQVKNGIAYPKIAQEYVDRTQNKKAMIKKGDTVYNAFIKRGWSWGGEWKNPDYQHFEKEIQL